MELSFHLLQFLITQMAKLCNFYPASFDGVFSLRVNKSIKLVNTDVIVQTGLLS